MSTPRDRGKPPTPAPSGDSRTQPEERLPTPREAASNDRAEVLHHVVNAEARRVLAEAQLQPDPARVAAGWERRFITDARRAEELMELYQELGFEVAADPVRAEEFGDDCEDCRLITLLQFQTIYTRRPRSEP